MITTEHSLWFIPLCLLLGIACAALVYWHVDKPEMPRKMKITLAIIRALVVSVIAFLLLHPVVNSTRKNLEKPVIAIGIDNTQSILIADKNQYYNTDFQKQLQSFLQKMRKHYQVDTYLIADNCQQGDSVDYQGKKTDLSSFFSALEAGYYRRNLGAVILLSDGIANAGGSPLYAAKKITAPVYTVTMGDTSQAKDALIAKVNYNRKVYLNNIFPLEILLKADGLSGNTATFTLYEDGQKVMEQPVHYNKNNFTQWVKLSFEAKKPGLHVYKMVLSETEGELTAINNKKEVAVEVLDKRKKVAVLYSSPHPDVAAVQRSLASSDAYETESFLIDDFSNRVSDYDIMVMHQLPMSAKSKTIVNEISHLGIPCLYMTGYMNIYNAFNASALGMQILDNRNIENDAYPIVNPNFSGISLSSEVVDFLDKVSPLSVPMANYQLSSQSQVVLYQKIGKVNTRYPLLVLQQNTSSRNAFMTGNGWWRWRLYDYMQYGTHSHFDDLILKIFQYIGVKEDKSFFRVSGKQIYAENEDVVFDAELYNANYELVNTPEVMMEIQGEGQKHQFAFSRYGKMYRLQAGELPVGNYQWRAYTRFNNGQYSQTGHFTVQEINMESLNLTADFQLMNNLAQMNGGQCFSHTQLDELYQAIRARDDIKSVAHYHITAHPLSQSLLLPVLLLLLMVTEYFMRKWYGGY